MESIDIIMSVYWNEWFVVKFIVAHLRVAVSELLSQGINASCTDHKLRSPLHVAAAAGNERIGQYTTHLLISRDVNKTFP